VLEGFATHDLRAAVTNAIKALPVGIIRGVNQLNTGKVEKIDVELLSELLDSGVIPVVPPLGFDGNGRTFRVNSDSIAVSVAEALGAVKLIFVTNQDGILGDGQVIREMPASSLEKELKREGSKFGNLSKARYAVKACHAGVPRVHVINGRTNEGLLTEVFSNEGIGTLIYANDYQQIRSARKKDVRVLVQLTRDSMVSEELSRRTRQEITRSLEDYYIFEIDRHPIGCVALHVYPEERKGELAFLCVSRSHENQGIGRRLIKVVEERARQVGVDQLFLLSTQSYTFFQAKAGFVEGSIDDLPRNRGALHVQSGRNSKILKKCLGAKTGAGVRAE
jgi:amino-acid N-acetyltransferase